MIVWLLPTRLTHLALFHFGYLCIIILLGIDHNLNPCIYKMWVYTYKLLLIICTYLCLIPQINNARISYNTGSDNSVECAENVINTNYIGTKNMVKATIPLMRPSAEDARIVLVSSWLGRLNGRRNVSLIWSFSLRLQVEIIIWFFFHIIPENCRCRFKTTIIRHWITIWVSNQFNYEQILRRSQRR